MELIIKGTPDEIKEVLQVIGGGEKHEQSTDNPANKIESFLKHRPETI